MIHLYRPSTRLPVGMKTGENAPIDESRCRASVGHGTRATTFSQCDRKWVMEVDGVQLCRQHAAQAAPDAPGNADYWLYVAEARYDWVNVGRIHVTNETNKTITVSKYEKVYGSPVVSAPQTVRKETHMVFASFEEVIGFIEKRRLIEREAYERIVANLDGAREATVVFDMQNREKNNV